MNNTNKTSKPLGNHKLLKVIKRLTHVEIEGHKKKGLYYNCDDKFGLGHHFPTQNLYVLDTDAPIEPPKNSFENVVVDIEKEPYKPNEVVPKISCNDLYNFSSPYTMKYHGYFKA